MVRIKRIKGNGCGVKLNLKLMQDGRKYVETKGPDNRGKKLKKEKDDE